MTTPDTKLITLEIRRPATSAETIVVSVMFVLAWAALLAGVALIFVPAALIFAGVGGLLSIYLYLSSRATPARTDAD